MCLIEWAQCPTMWNGNLYKQRSKNAGIEWLPQPESLEKWVNPDRLRYFMRYISRITLGAHHFALFTIIEELKVLAKCKSIFSDGTFKVPEFYQVSVFLEFHIAQPKKPINQF